MIADVALPDFDRHRFFGLVEAQTLEKVSPADAVGVELGTFPADELRPVVQQDPATAPHAGSVEPGCVETDQRLQPCEAGSLGDEFHYDDRTDVQGAAEAFFRIRAILECLGDEGLVAVRAVVRADDQLVRAGAHALLP